MGILNFFKKEPVLQWTKFPHPDKLSYIEAEDSIIRENEIENSSSWRLPTSEELMEWLKIAPRDSFRCGDKFWTSDKHTNYIDVEWCVYITESGDIEDCLMWVDDKCLVWLVRNA